MTFADANVDGLLQRSFAEGCAAHAYVVQGSKRTLPELLRRCAMVALCPNHSEDGCEVCRKVKTGVHQDVVWFPQDGKRLTVADMNMLVEESYKRPIDDGDARVFVVDASQSASGVGADVWQNKLLKTLEEPNPDVYIFIGVTDVFSLLPTVRSRCQVLVQSRASEKQVCDELCRRGYDRKKAQIVSAVSGGSAESAEALLSDLAVLRSFETASEFLTEAASTKYALPFVSKMLADRDHFAWCLDFMALLLRESVVYRLAENLCVLDEYGEVTQKICQNYSLQAAEVCIEKINCAKRRLAEGGNQTVIADSLIAAMLEVKYRCRI